MQSQKRQQAERIQCTSVTGVQTCALPISVKEESEKVGLKLNIQKTKIMASGSITSWQIDGETMETVKDGQPRSEGAQYATGDSGEITPERIKGRNQRKNNTQLWMSLVIEARSDAVKSNIA